MQIFIFTKQMNIELCTILSVAWYIYWYTDKQYTKFSLHGLTLHNDFVCYNLRNVKQKLSWVKVEGHNVPLKEELLSAK